MAIIEAAVADQGRAGPSDVLAEVRRLGLRTPNEAAAVIRTDRDAHSGPV